MKRTIYFLAFLFICLTASANKQDDKFRLSEQLLQYIMDGKGEEAHQMLNDKVKTMIPVEQMTNLWKQLTAQVGAFQSKDEWQEQVVADKTIYFCDMQFEHMALRCNTAFDKDGFAIILNFVPAPAKPKSTAAKADNAQMKETDIKVVTGKFELPGILCMPLGKESAAIVILVQGSGPNDRDETIGPNKPFRDLAWGLAKQGIASIRYDKRTKVYGAQSVAPDEEASMENEYVQDVLSAVQLAKNTPGIDKKRIYIVGHSQGAMLAPRFAQRCKDIKGIVMMSANARPLEDLVLEQMKYIFSLDSISKDEEKQLTKIKQQMANVKKLGTKNFDSKIALPLELPASYWKDINGYHQLKVAKSLTCPILILQGVRDYQVTMVDFSLWWKELAGKKNVTFYSYPKLNHLYMIGSGKSAPSEYNQAGSIPEYVTKDIANWVNKQN